MATRLFQNLRFAVRTMARQPLFAAVIVITLALGSGATIAIFSVVDAVLVRPLPYPDPERLVSLLQVSEAFGSYGFAPPFIDDLRERTTSYTQLAGFSSTWELTLTGAAGEPRVVPAAYVTDGIFELLGARLTHGRDFLPAEHALGGPSIAVVTERFWSRHLGAGLPFDQRIIRLGGDPYTIVGIVDDDLRMPITTSAFSEAGGLAEVWLPFATNGFAQGRNVPVMNVVGRLAEDVTEPAALAELQTVLPGLQRDFPDAGLAAEVRVVSLAGMVSRGVRSTVLLLFAAAGLLLLIACVNVANLLLARATTRRGELAIRSSLGATAGRVVEQLLTESLLVASLGSATGLALAAGILWAVPALGLQGLPASAVVRVDARVAGFSIVLVFATAALFGIAPAFRGARKLARPGPLSGWRGSTDGSDRLRRILVAVEVAMAVVLLVGAGLLARSFRLLTRVDPGFRTEGLVAAPLRIEEAGYATPESRRELMRGLLSQVAGVPGVEQVSAVNRLPLGGANVIVGVEAEGRPTGDDAPPLVDRRVATPGYFATVGIPIVDGREFDLRDDAAAESRAAIVNQTAARLFWPDLDPIDRRLRLLLRSGPGPWLSIVGVVGDVRHHGLDQEPAPEIYVPYEQASVETMTLLVHTKGESAMLVASIKERIWRLEPDLPLDGIVEVAAVVEASVSEPRFRMLVLNSFAALAAALAAMGLAGVVSYSVVRRQRDIGIRVALGARESEILWATVGEGLKLGAVGAAAGLIGSLSLTGLLSTLLFEISPTDPLTFGAVIALLLVIVAAASWLPARRATRVDPVAILRTN